MAVFVFASVFLTRAALGHAELPSTAWLALAMWCAHFARRSAESAWLHRYGKPSVPTGDVITEYIYYWGFAAWNAVSLTAPAYRGSKPALVALRFSIFVLAELGNARAHRMLRDLRPAGTKLRVIPRGFLFERVSCPHYLCEILSWVGFAIVTETWAALAFLLLGSGILAAWARSRHAAYRKDFDGREGREMYPPSRRALLPGVF
jgi:very-long-chain enoyl-CoA reductase